MSGEDTSDELFAVGDLHDPAAGVAAGVLAESGQGTTTPTRTNVPGTFAVAFNCVADSAVPAWISAGLAQVITGVAFAIASCFELSLLPLKLPAGV